MAVEDDKLESLARWLNENPNDWNLWPYLLHSKAEAQLVMTRLWNGYFDSFRVDTALLEFSAMAVSGGIALKLRVIG